MTSRVPAALPWLGLALAATVFAAAIVQPFDTGPVAFDAAASVVYFDRIVSGQRLETFVNTTPKPLLTLTYGVLHGLTGDWRAISWATIVAFGVAVALGARLAWRLAGATAAVAAAILVAGSVNLLVQVTWAHGLPWAIGLWLLAGIALTEDRPRYGLAGLALMLAALARQETFLLLAVLTLGLAWRAFRAGVPRVAWSCLAGWLALPIMLLHDAALTGDPFYWTRVASIYAEGQDVRSPVRVAGIVVGLVSADPAIAFFAVLGVVWLLRRGATSVAIGVVTIAAGTGLLLLVLAARHLHVLFTYLHPIDLALRFGAAFGIAWALTAIGLRLRSGEVVAVGAAVLIASVIGGLPGLGGTVPEPIRIQHEIARHSDRAATIIAGNLEVGSGAGVPEHEPDETARPDPDLIRVLVPRTVQSRLAVDLGLSMATVGPLIPDVPAPFLLRPGQLVYHDRLADTPPTDLTTGLEAPGPTTIEGIRLEPILFDPGAGIWIWRTLRPPG